MKKLKLSGISKIIIPIASLLLFYQCMHDEFELDKLDDEMEIIAGILSPIAYGSLNIGDLISELDSSGFITTDPDGLLHLTYQDSLFSYIANDLMEIPSQDFFEFFIESDFTIPPGWGAGETVILNHTKNFPFAFSNNEQLDSIILDEGNMIFDITSEFLHTGQIIITCPNIRKDNTPFTDTIPIDVSNGNFTYNEPFVLDGYTIYLSDSVTIDSSFSYMPVDFHVELINSGAGFNLGERISIVATIEDLNFDAIFGYIGNYELLGQADELDIGFFENPMDGTIRFENPQINFNISNSYGVPAQIDINHFTGFDANGDSVELSLDASVNPFEYEYPDSTDYANNDYIKETTLNIKSTNSKVSDLIALMPSRIEYNISAASNPDNDPSIYNFVDDNSKIDVSFEIILPLWFEADNFAFSDTLEDILAAGWSEDADMIDQINIMLEVFNGMPIDIDFQVTFLDSLYNPVDTLFKGSQPIILAANIDQDYNVTSTSRKTSYIQYKNADIEKMENARHAIIRAGLKTPTVGENVVPVKFLDTYSIDFNLSIGVNIKVNTNDL